jgi:circadian clock protein KaiC
LSTALRRLETHVPGLDHITEGGLVAGRLTVVAGPPGSAKTTLAGQLLAEAASRGTGVLMVTFEEPADDVRRNLGTVGFDVAALEAAGKWAFVDASPVVRDDDDDTERPYDFEGLSARIGHEADRVAAELVALDSVHTAFGAAEAPTTVRRVLQRLTGQLRRMGTTVLLTVETDSAADPASAFGIEAFVADTVLQLRNTLDEEKRRRTVEVLKMRGASHRKGEYPFTVMPGRGVVVIPLTSIELTQRSSDERTSSGNPELDAMCGGGFFRDSVVLASGATGTGKTLVVTEFLAGGVAAGERSLLLAFEESRDQIFRNARGWGRDFAALEKDGLLLVESVYPETASLEDHLVSIKKRIDEFGPRRVAVDSLSALERVGTNRAFREFIIGLTSFVKEREVTALFTATSPTLAGGTSVTEGHISTLTDTILLLRYVEMFGEVRRGLTVLKMRGSTHDKRIREFTIDGSGMHVGGGFRGLSGILGGLPTVDARESSWATHGAAVGTRKPGSP